MSYFPLFPFWFLAVGLERRASCLEISRGDRVFGKQVPTWEAVALWGSSRQTTLQDKPARLGWKSERLRGHFQIDGLFQLKVGVPQSRMEEISRMFAKSPVPKENPAPVRADTGSEASAEVRGPGILEEYLEFQYPSPPLILQTR